jgi:hypothetical protein
LFAPIFFAKYIRAGTTGIATAEAAVAAAIIALDIILSKLINYAPVVTIEQRSGTENREPA